jgi:chlorophyllide a reductase subunit Z
MYQAEVAAAGGPGGPQPSYIAASFPGAVIRRATGTPFMGYAGATWLVQEFCNALFDALFHVLPLGTELDRIQATPARHAQTLAWDDDASALLAERVAAEPVLVQISAAKRLRDRAEQHARKGGAARVSAAHVLLALQHLGALSAGVSA